MVPLLSEHAHQFKLVNTHDIFDVTCGIFDLLNIKKS